MKKVLIFYFVCFSNILIASPIWQRDIINYDRMHYNAASQNWMIDQSDKGWIYSANSAGLLEFDGVKWSLYEVKNKFVRSVKVIGERIYVGGNVEFGYFEPDDIGKLCYTSLAGGIRDWGGDVWNVLELSNCIYFVSDMHVFEYNKENGEVKSLVSEYKINASCIYDNSIVLGTTKGIAYVKEDIEKEPYITYTEDVVSDKIIKLLSYNNKLFVVTAMGGIYYKESDGLLLKFEIEPRAFIDANQLFSAAIVENRLVLGSVQNGALIIDMENKAPPEFLNIKNGLRNNTVLNILADKKNNLWLALDRGLSYIDISSSFRPLFANISPVGTGYCSIMYNDKLYLGTNQGVYTFDKNGECYLVHQTEGQIWSFNIIDDKLFCSGDNNITVITRTEQYSLGVTSVWETQVLDREGETIVAGLYSGVAVLKKRNGRWHFSHNLPVYGLMRGFVEGDEPYTLFYIKDNSTIVRGTFDKNYAAVINEKSFPIEGNLIRENMFFRKIDNQVTICTDKGIFSYSKLLDGFHKYTQLEQMLDGEDAYNLLSVDSYNNIWFSTDKTLKLLPFKDGRYEDKANSLGSVFDETTDNLGNIYSIDSSHVILATEGGFSKLDLKQDISEKKSFQAHIRSMSCGTQGDIISYGYNKLPLEIAYKDNSVIIEYSTTLFSNSADIKYVFRFKDRDKEWSNPTPSTSKEYTNLFEGDYEFEVRALNNIDGDYSDIASIQFKILPPWYRSNIAYIIYFLWLCSVLYISYFLTINRQKKIISQQKIESEIKDQEIYQLQNKNLKDELTYKTQELSGYILNVTRKNEMLEDVKKEAFGVTQAIDESRPNSEIKQRVTKLISQINNNIERDSDFKVFQSNFNIVHQDFFNLLDEKIPNLTRNEKILCAYLNMNLSSKEIASLLNISIRGVEISRYRLRKKIGLGREVNLTEFMQNL